MSYLVNGTNIAPIAYGTWNGSTLINNYNCGNISNHSTGITNFNINNRLSTNTNVVIVATLHLNSSNAPTIGAVSTTGNTIQVSTGRFQDSNSATLIGTNSAYNFIVYSNT